MNREIKFRAWRKDKMTDCRFIDFAHGYIETNDRGDWDLDSDVILMQYTGLKDKNGKEIYEGDIVQFNAGFSKETKTPPILDKVEFINGAFLPRPYKGEDCQVIGNVFEHPDLLTPLTV